MTAWISFLFQDDNAVDMLKRLKNLPISLEILQVSQDIRQCLKRSKLQRISFFQKTRIGMTVNELRKKSERKDVQAEAKNLIKAWKKLLGKAGYFKAQITCSNNRLVSDSNGKDGGDGKAGRERVGLPRNDSFASNISDSLDGTVSHVIHSYSGQRVSTSLCVTGHGRQFQRW